MVRSVNRDQAPDKYIRNNIRKVVIQIVETNSRVDRRREPAKRREDVSASTENRKVVIKRLRREIFGRIVRDRLRE